MLGKLEKVSCGFLVIFWGWVGRKKKGKAALRPEDKVRGAAGSSQLPLRSYFKPQL